MIGLILNSHMGMQRKQSQYHPGNNGRDIVEVIVHPMKGSMDPDSRSGITAYLSL